MLPATRHTWTRPALTPARLVSTQFIFPERIEGWVGYIPRWFICPQTVTHLSSNHLIATRPAVEPTTCWSQSNVLIVTRPNHMYDRLNKKTTILQSFGHNFVKYSNETLFITGTHGSACPLILTKNKTRKNNRQRKKFAKDRGRDIFPMCTPGSVTSCQ